MLQCAHSEGPLEIALAEREPRDDEEARKTKGP